METLNEEGNTSDSVRILPLEVPNKEAKENQNSSLNLREPTEKTLLFCLRILENKDK